MQNMMIATYSQTNLCHVHMFAKLKSISKFYKFFFSFVSYSKPR